MKVVRKTRQTVAFCDLEIGDQFEGRNVHMKIAHKKGEPNAVVLSGCGEGTVVTFEEDILVTPVTIELHVSDKE